MRLSEHSAFESLLARPGYLRGESLPGYLARLMWANGRMVSLRTAREVVTVHGWWSDTEKAEAALQAMLGPSIPLDVLRWNRLRPTEVVFQHWRAHWYEAMRQVRYCGPCVKRFGIHRIEWQLPAVKACAEHGCGLIDCCAECGHGLTWPTLDLGWQCICGAELPMNTELACEDEEISFARRIGEVVRAAIAAPAGRQQAAAMTLIPIYAALLDASEMLARAHRLRRRRPWREWLAHPAMPRRHQSDGAKCLLQAMSLNDSMWLRRLISEHHDFGDALLSDLTGSALLRSVKWLVQSSRRSPQLRTWLSEQLDLMHKDCCAPLPARPTVLMDPSLPAATRERRLLAFRDWWHGVAPQRGVVDGASLARESAARKAAVSSSALLVLRALFLASARAPSWDGYRAVLRRWRWAALPVWSADPRALVGQIHESLPTAPKELAECHREMVVYVDRAVAQDAHAERT